MNKDKWTHFADKLFELYKGTGCHFTANDALRKMQENKVGYSRDLTKHKLARILLWDSKFERSEEKVRIDDRWKYVYWVKE
ncbi:hypothetical protein KAR91_21755 [Candidatus Pacearchaeota archaeon]|nr:hypothetical protein [Candidatus Pacearchaeota archaeon]